MNGMEREVKKNDTEVNHWDRIWEKDSGKKMAREMNGMNLFTETIQVWLKSLPLSNRVVT